MMTTSRPDPIPEDDEALLAQCRVETFRAGGPGGQHQNTTETGVRVVHLPSGMRASARDHRSQARNRKLAVQRLREKIEARRRIQKPRKKTKPSSASVRRRKEAKRQRSERKRMRRKPRRDD